MSENVCTRQEIKQNKNKRANHDKKKTVSELLCCLLSINCMLKLRPLVDTCCLLQKVELLRYAGELLVLTGILPKPNLVLGCKGIVGFLVPVRDTLPALINLRHELGVGHGAALA